MYLSNEPSDGNENMADDNQENILDEEEPDLNEEGKNCILQQI